MSRPSIGLAGLMQVAVQAALAAGEILKDAKPSGVARKQDGSPVTEADRDADALIRRHLGLATPEIPCISEESGVPPPGERAGWDRFWLVDPLDGTKEFLAGRDDFTVNVALVENGVPVVGAVLAPRSGLLYHAASGLGSWRRESGGESVRISRAQKPAGCALVIVESRSHPDAVLEEFFSSLAIERRIPLGSSLKLCWVAEGKADLYARLGPTMEWDIAAGECVYLNASEPPAPSLIRYGKPDLKNGPFLAGPRWAAEAFEQRFRTRATLAGEGPR